MNSLKIGFINIYGQTGFSSNKVLELENFISCNKLDVVCLQETDIDQNTFSECNILRKFSPIINNSSTGYGTCTLVSKDLSVDNIIKDSDGRFTSEMLTKRQLRICTYQVVQIKIAKPKEKT